MELPGGPYAAVVEKIVAHANTQSHQQQSPCIEPAHILLALLTIKGNSALKALDALGHSPDHIAHTLRATMPTTTARAAETPLPLCTAGRQVLHNAQNEARNLGHPQIEAVHLLLGMLYDDHDSAAMALSEAGISLVDMREYLLQQPRKRTVAGASSGGFPLPSPIFLLLLLVVGGSGAVLYTQVWPTLNTLFTFLFVVSGWIASVCVHEFGHALAAYYGGDSSVKEAGYLSLNPARYTQPLLSIVLPLVILFLGGLGLPGGAVYINPLALRSPGWRSFVAAAGPLGTVLAGVLIIAPFALGLAPDTLALLSADSGQSVPFWAALAFLGFLQVTALLFNLIPLPPLDGFGMVEPFLPPAIADQMRRWSGLLFLLLLIILWTGGPLTTAFWQEIFTLAKGVGIPLELIIVGMRQFLFWR